MANLVIGTAGDDKLYGSVVDDLLQGLGGRDSLYGYGGNDTLEGGSGSSDELYGGQGNDVLYAGTASDSVKDGYGYLYGGAGDDVLIGADNSYGYDYLVGGDGNDTLSGLTGDDYLYGDSGNDSLSGMAGNDVLRDSGGGINVLLGGDGDDTFEVYSSSPTDSSTLTGGPGADRYKLVYYNTSALTVSDFTPGVGGDLIDIDGLLVNSTGYSAGNPFDASLAYLRLVQNGADVQLQWDRDGTGTGYAWKPVLTLQNLDLALNPLVAQNFAPMAPPSGGSVGLTVIGTAGNDTLYGSVVDDLLQGLGGRDSLYGYGGNDTLEGGSGSSDIYGGQGNDVLYAGTASDSVKDGYGDLYGEAGDDVLIGADSLYGYDYLVGGAGNDTLSGLAGNDYLYGDSGNDSLSGMAGNDVLRDWGGGINVLLGGDGDDTFEVYSYSPTDSSTLTGGPGVDRYRLVYYNTSALTVTDFTPGVGGDLIDIDGLLVHSAGNPFDASLAYLRLVQNGADVQLQWDSDGTGTGDAWKPVLTLQNLDLALNPLVAQNFAPMAPPSGGSVGLTIIGTAGNDTLWGSVVDDLLQGLGGRDSLYGYGGNDTLEGGSGSSDELYGGQGNDVLYAGTASDSVKDGYSDLYGEAGDDVLIGADNSYGYDYLIGGDGNDTLSGLAGDDTLSGGSGNDSLSGMAGNDRLYDSGGGINVLLGGDGDDTLEVYSSSSSDSSTLTGGPGADRYRLDYYNTSALTVTDFTPGVGGDLIDIDGLLVHSTGYSAGNPFDASLAYLRLVQNGADVQLQWDRDGTGTGYAWKPVLTLQNLDLALNPPADRNFVPNLGAPPLNLAPRLTSAAATLADGVEDDASYQVTLAELLTGWTDPEGDPLAVLTLTADHATGATWDPATATWTLAPAANYSGPVRLSYQVTDGINTMPATLSFTLAPVNDAPTLTLAAPANVNEGAGYALSLTTLDIDNAADQLSYTVDWGDATPAQLVSGSDLAALGGVVGHVYADDPDGPINAASHTLKVTASDGSGGTAVQTLGVTVDNVAPTIALTGADKVNGGALYTLNLGTVADPGSDAVSRYTVHWGDGQTDNYTAGGDVSHLYAAGTAALRAIRVDLTDEDGSFANAGSKTVAVYETLKLGDAPTQVLRSTPNVWIDAWTNPAVTISHKADYGNDLEGWTAVKLNGLNAGALSGGDLSAGDLGVSGQTLATSAIKQEIDGTEALRFAVSADQATISLSRFNAGDDGLETYVECGRLQAFKDGELVDELVFTANAGGTKQITLTVDGGFDTLVLTSGAYDAGDKFIAGAYAAADGSFAGAPYLSDGTLHGSEFLVDALLIGISPSVEFF